MSTPSDETITTTIVRNACIVTNCAIDSVATIVTSPITPMRNTIRTQPAGLTVFCDSSSRKDRVSIRAGERDTDRRGGDGEHDPSPARQPREGLLLLLAVDREDRDDSQRHEADPEADLTFTPGDRHACAPSSRGSYRHLAKPSTAATTPAPPSTQPRTLPPTPSV